MYETAEQAYEKIATRDTKHPLELIGRRVFCDLSPAQWIEVLAAVCRNNLEHDMRVPNLAAPLGGVVQDDADIFPMMESITVPSGGRLVISPIRGGFECKWHP